jgi:hypothetical protein
LFSALAPADRKINALEGSGFPHCGKGTYSLRPPFAPKQAGVGMAGHRKSAASRKAATRKTPRKAARKTTRRKTTRRKASPARWSQRVTKESDALDLRQGVFTLADPKMIAASLKRSAESSSRRKAGAYRSALSMLTFYFNRAGRTLPKAQRERLQRAKLELRRQFGRDKDHAVPRRASA